MAPQLAALLDRHPRVRHIRIEDARGKPLGRSFRVKLWPSFVFLNDGHVVRQLARPTAEEIREGLEAITEQTA